MPPREGVASCEEGCPCVASFLLPHRSFPSGFPRRCAKISRRPVLIRAVVRGERLDEGLRRGRYANRDRP
jgi:hypothetical protein